MIELDRLSDELFLPSSVKEQAAQIYRKALNKGLTRGRSILAIMAASLYAASRLTANPKTLKQVAKSSLSNWKAIARSYRLLLRELEINVPAVDSVSCVPKIASKIGIDDKTQQKAVNILSKAEGKTATVGKDPMGLAAAAVYIACIINCDSRKRTQKEVATAADITEVTLRKRYKSLRKLLKLDI